jgi:type I restriction enzyme S subunit
LVTKGSSPKWQGVGYVDKHDGLLFITSENVGNFSLRKLDDLKYVESRFKKVEPRSMLRRDDILINLVGASIGRTAIYDLDHEANINQAVALVRMVDPNERPSLDYLLKYLNSDLAVDLMLGSRVTTAQPNISLTDVTGFPIPIPPLAEQHRIVAKVDALMALCDRLETALTTTDTTRTRLLESLLHEALEPAADALEAAE